MLFPFYFQQSISLRHRVKRNQVQQQPSFRNFLPSKFQFINVQVGEFREECFQLSEGRQSFDDAVQADFQPTLLANSMFLPVDDVVDVLVAVATFEGQVVLHFGCF